MFSFFKSQVLLETQPKLIRFFDNIWLALGIDLHGFSQRFPQKSRRIAVVLLATGETLAWASLYYVFAALLLTWEQSLGWQKSELTLGITIAMLVSACVSPMAGKIIDHGGGRWLLSGGLVIGAFALMYLSTITQLSGFITAWVMIGVAQGMSLYEPCFAFVSRNLKNNAAGAITTITLAAGFASTLAYPSFTVLTQWFDWRVAVMVASGVLLLIATPMLHAGATLIECCSDQKVMDKSDARPKDKAFLRRPMFWLLFFTFPLIATTIGMVLMHCIPILVEKQLTISQAVLAVSLVGPMQVSGRLLMVRLSHRINPILMAMVCYLGILLALVILFFTNQFYLGLAFALIFGGFYGLTSILKPLIIARAMGYQSLGAITGYLALPYLTGGALAPIVASVLWQKGGYDLPIQVIIVTTFLALMGMAMVYRLERKN